MKVKSALILIFLIFVTKIYFSNASIAIISNCQELQNMKSTGIYSISQIIDCSGIVPFNSIPLFSGTLQGNNNIIQNVVLNSSLSQVGIFKCLSGATIQDLVLLNFTANSSFSCVGSLSGKATNTNITNVHLKALSSSPNLICGSSFVGG